MPKSKREQKVTLSKTQKKGRVRKESLMEEVRACVDQYSSLYVFTADNMRNAALKDVRAALKTSRIFFGRNKLIAAALGRSSSDEFRDGLSKVSSMLLGGEAGLLFTNEPTAAVRRCFESAQVAEYARAGSAATHDVALEAGPLNFPHSMEPYLRKLGLPTLLANGVVTLLADYSVCSEGQELNGEQAKLLQLLDIKMATFALTLKCRWSADDFLEL
jgi:mRNA turnover protein 4